MVTNAIINKGRTLEEMAKILGHSSPQTTLEYVVIDPDRLKKMYEDAL